MVMETFDSKQTDDHIQSAPSWPQHLEFKRSIIQTSSLKQIQKHLQVLEFGCGVDESTPQTESCTVTQIFK